MKRLLKAMFWFIATNVALKAAAVIATNLIGEETSEDSDEFRLVALMDGRTYESVAEKLRTGTIIAVAGGVDIDLRQALLDPEGASLDVTIVAGGVRVLACKSWRVEVEKSTAGAAVQIETPDPDSLPDGAPILHVKATTIAGGLVIANAESESHVVRQS
jgi:hypothetical protein